jgi:hypothetical protein
MTAPPDGRARHAPTDLESELLAAEKDFENGNFRELTLVQLDRCIETGEWPWPEESSA